MGLDDDFKTAADEATKLPSKPSDADMLVLYGLFKQANVGDCNTSKPGFLDMKGRAKWDAWKKLEGKGQDDAKRDYISKVEELKSA
eukprot:CAMPEP_0119131306 /NCGR_PEP_ID=MMETSP1310-20130426/9990_1 /TAXON_ID=464262 /ORGANISM="Genus nov. species nov., Strain RCC2339" /LENGTH=85 /DNA_ID=CAMNT_0007121871 /DNA_START=23 /DNA_END=280 /DNA_ORIENTATION=+